MKIMLRKANLKKYPTLEKIMKETKEDITFFILFNGKEYRIEITHEVYLWTEIFIGNTLKEAILKTYMFLKHDKVWDKEKKEWVKFSNDIEDYN